MLNIETFNTNGLLEKDESALICLSIIDIAENFNK